MHLSPAIPIIRIFSEEKAREFYVDFLGFTIDWEHRFDANFPLYAQVRRSELILHLSEHHGDATPGSTIFVRVQDIDALHAELQRKDYKYGKPGIEEVPWGKELETIDPFGNRIRFSEAPKEDVREA
ncbi:glyoxalase superfamily protein [Paraburkholderia sediminicola]|uniref:glyoxalase superfamily protein n=1 Tax=Paraburkholderia TaxID=1822464 RepID=UPI0038BCBF79